MEKANELQPADGETERDETERDETGRDETETRHDKGDMEYPTSLKLGLITLALALSVFLIFNIVRCCILFSSYLAWAPCTFFWFQCY